MRQLGLLFSSFLWKKSKTPFAFWTATKVFPWLWKQTGIGFFFRLVFASSFFFLYFFFYLPVIQFLYLVVKRTLTVFYSFHIAFERFKVFLFSLLLLLLLISYNNDHLRILLVYTHQPFSSRFFPALKKIFPLPFFLECPWSFFISKSKKKTERKLSYPQESTASSSFLKVLASSFHLLNRQTLVFRSFVHWAFFTLS